MPAPKPSSAEAPPRWVEAAERILAGGFHEAAETYETIGALPEAADARLRATERLIGEGRRAEGEVELATAVTFFRQVGATAFLRRAEALLPAST